MLNGLTRVSTSSELESILDIVQSSGEIAVVFTSPSIGDLETITSETQRRQLRIAGIPRGGYTILPAIPLYDDELLQMCERYTSANEYEKAEMRNSLYMREYPLFTYSIRHQRALFHPADYVSRILQFCSYYVQAPDADVLPLQDKSPFLHISPIKEICKHLRLIARGTPVAPDDSESPVPEQLRLHAESDAEKLAAERATAMSIATSSGGASETEQPSLFSGVAPSALFQKGAVEEVDKDAEDTMEDLTGEETVDAVHSFQAEYLTLDGFELVTKASIYYDREGEGQRIVAVYIPGGVPEDTCRAAAAVLEPAATKKNLRAPTNGGLPPDTGIVGYYDYLTNPTQHKCRETEYSRRNWGLLAQSEPLLKHLDKLYSQLAPMHHHLQRVAIPSQYQLCGTVFSTITVNRNFRTAVHTDKGDFRSGLGVLSVINGEFEGCHLAIKRLKKAFQLKVGDVLLFDTSLEHGNTEVVNPEIHWQRTSVVCYLRTGLMSSVCEMERRKHLNRLILLQLLNTEVRNTTVNINGADSSLPPLFVPTRLASHLAPVQLAALGFIVERTEKQSGCVVAMTMGLGKTLVALTLCFSQLHLAPQADILILTPKPIISHWVDEKNKWGMHGLHFPHFVASDGLNSLEFEQQLLEYERQRNNEKPKLGHIFVINGEYLAGFLRRFKRFTPLLMIVDEGHRVAAKGNKLTESLDRLRCNLRIVLSGTPLQNDASELYRLVGWVNKGVSRVLPPKRFQELANDINQFVEGDDGAFYNAVMAQEYIQDWMRGFVFREMENDLPPLHDYLLICGSSDVQREYEEKLGLTETAMTALKATEHRPHHLSTHPACYLAFISDSYQSMVSGWTVRAQSNTSRPRVSQLEEIDTMRLEQYVQLVENEQLDAFIDLSGKMRVLVDIVLRVQARKEKLIIFSLYVGSQDLIHRTLTALRVCTFTVRGRDSQDRRRRAMQEFSENKDLIVLVLSTKIAAYGLDFTAANHVVLFDSWWNPQVDAQAIARAYRRNQRKPVTVYRLISATENKFVLRSQTRKIALFKCILHERTSRQALPDELEDCAANEKDEERRIFWAKLKTTSLAGDSRALLNVYRYQESVRESE
ncbi:JBP2 / j-binding protein [Leishmania donovani]|uniref:Bifunctional helicase and thymine dioxygenase JBP2 n=2 Tax=Leishmania donovani TaxID=5661 RepID=A0A6J8F6T5_LEIDO|nr:JBP2 / j-binding protein [Leishmania donovani]VDZ43157.1 j-binding_protein_putative/GeneDB:LmjF.14.0040 [Leishmania donovani]